MSDILSDMIKEYTKMHFSGIPRYSRFIITRPRTVTRFKYCDYRVNHRVHEFCMKAMFKQGYKNLE